MEVGIDFVEEKLLSKRSSKLLFMSLLFLLFAVFLMRVVLFTCCGLALLLALGFCSFWRWNEVGTLMTTNSLQGLFVIAVTFLLILHSSGLKQLNCSLVENIRGICFPWQCGKLACHRAYHMGKPSCWELYRSYVRSLC